MKILGIGNAIVDVLCKVDDNFLKDNSLTKSTMKLVDENEFKNLISKLKIEETVSGGSVANSIVGLSQLGNDVGFIGKINNDNLGQQYEDGLIKERVSFIYSKKGEAIPTGTCLILITPDSERTMCTFLGIAGKINEKDVNIEKVKESDIVFLEGYLWDEGEPKKAFEKAINNSNKVAMSLSDLFCVERHKESFLELVKNKLDVIFANEQEIFSLIETNSFEEHDQRFTFFWQRRKVCDVQTPQRPSGARDRKEPGLARRSDGFSGCLSGVWARRIAPQCSYRDHAPRGI